MDPFDEALLESVARVLGHADDGLTHEEIRSLLDQLDISDPKTAAEAQAPAGHWVKMNKKERIRLALAERQRSSKTGDSTIKFIKAAMSPVRYVERPDVFNHRLASLNEVLSSAALEVRADGKIARLTAAATTLDQMALRAGALTSELKRRSCHAKVTKYCAVELLRKSNFHAAEEAVKGLFDRLREETGSTLDGAALVDDVFAFNSVVPVLAMSKLSTQSERSEQAGFMNLLKGLFGMYRNPLAHDTRVRRDGERPITDRELVGLLTTLSLAHDHIDRCHNVRRA
jgi:uncharacterized protein (TIGR02391 family)